jgi:Rrf2 family nitric oxide-sensitive transcriptional repressor
LVHFWYIFCKVRRGLAVSGRVHLSKFADYSLRVMVLAAARSPGGLSVDDLVAAYGVSRHHLVKVVQRLGQLGWLETKRGPGGGLRLAAGAEAVTVGEVVRRTEPSLALAECFDGARNRCRLTPVCRLKGVLAAAQGAFFERLDEVTLGDLAGNRDEILQRFPMVAEAGPGRGLARP